MKTPNLNFEWEHWDLHVSYLLTCICAPGMGEAVMDISAACDAAAEAAADDVVVTALTGIPGDGDADRCAGKTGD